ncbi:MAG TPA: asparagine--tRNA ligase, partial [Microscillaceae bacterium]|nr:asparagine--tRNA ligase [Microscillaceae bacterium]
MKAAISVKEILHKEQFGDTYTLKGWVRNKRESKNVFFIMLNDGSCLASLQVVADASSLAIELLKDVTVGACIEVAGRLQESRGSGQLAELNAETLVILGKADAEKYPLQPKAHSLEYLREIAHLRFRTKNKTEKP